MEPQTVKIPLNVAIDAARDLNEYVVSLDRIFSRLGTGEYDERILSDYVVDRRVLQRIAALRAHVFDALEEVVGAEKAEEIAEESYTYTDPT
ncbi:hypothetical protein ABT160_42430 [Streptomyces sp. NPDC001941]|uniref:hypothetical protein n=1 Tax=Streptomyces sp. NPDC001941 TaxID=3154659 RepID=UPI00331D3CFE